MKTNDKQDLSQPVVTRFAPSPTGMLHIGGLRSALFNWLWARKHQGKFLLRIEDTDQDRLNTESIDHIINSLKWLGLDWDFGPDKPHPEYGHLVQSKRLEIYHEHAEKLIDLGVAYRDWTTSEELAELRLQAQREKRAFVFRKSMAKLSGPKGQEVIRIAIPNDFTIEWLDAVHGQQSWQGSDIGDFVAVKSDGYPTYQLANVVDDHLMQVSHVIRADEWLSSTPKHLYLFDQFGWQRPAYVHVPPILAPGGKRKLSKRDGAKDAIDYAVDGYLPQALLNYLCLLGWNPGTEQEIFTTKELIQAFDLSRIQKAGAHFDQDRLDWMNGMHIRELGVNKLIKIADDGNWWPDSAKNFDESYKEQIMRLVYERLKKFAELSDLSQFFFEEPKPVDESEIVKITKIEVSQQQELLSRTKELLADSDFSQADLEEKLYKFAKSNNLKVGKFFMLLRLKLTGSRFSPGLFETMHVLGPETCLKRLK